MVNTIQILMFVLNLSAKARKMSYVMRMWGLGLSLDNEIGIHPVKSLTTALMTWDGPEYVDTNIQKLARRLYAK